MEDSAVAQAKAIPSLLAHAPNLQRRGAGLRCSFLLQIGETHLHADLADARLELTPGPLLMRSWRFALRGDAQAWSAFWEAEPAPGFHDIFALTKAQRFVLEGDLHPFMSSLLFFKDLLALPRAASS
ncbi:MAG: hypothetical protein JWN07_606 [Hyphomicrobiales bacterium]|nr:hypothetical protein [Hyphomicrobiales bacterium]